MRKPGVEHFEGCLLGVAIGDALGAPFEGRWVPQDLSDEALFGGFRRLEGYPRGQVTDDTQLTLETVHSMLSRGEIDGEDMLRRFGQLWRSGEIVGPGNACTLAVSNMLRGMSWREAGAPVGQAGNGSAMRASPLGLWFCRAPKQIPQMAELASSITHRDPRCKAGMAVVALAITKALSSTKLDFVKDVLWMRDLVSRISEEFAYVLDRLVAWWQLPMDEAVKWIIHEGQFGPYRGSWSGRVTPYVVPTVLISLYAFYKHCDDYRSGLSFVLRIGGDTDTVGAITGGLIGARVGVKGLPEVLRENVVLGGELKRAAGDLYRLWTESGASES
jgi:ADP-ribosyl-[dinitrogen reductase] hydrolase